METHISYLRAPYPKFQRPRRRPFRHDCWISRDFVRLIQLVVCHYPLCHPTQYYQRPFSTKIRAPIALGRVSVWGCLKRLDFGECSHMHAAQITRPNSLWYELFLYLTTILSTSPKIGNGLPVNWLGRFVLKSLKRKFDCKCDTQDMLHISWD